MSSFEPRRFLVVQDIIPFDLDKGDRTTILCQKALDELKPFIEDGSLVEMLKHETVGDTRGRLGL